MKRHIIAAALGTAMALVLGAAPAPAAPQPDTSPSLLPLAGSDLYVLTDDGTLSQRSGLLPNLVLHQARVTGLEAGDRLVGLDTRPATGQLYALGAQGQLYTIQPHTGRATAVGTGVALAGGAIGFDFNPTVDRIRVVTSSGQNLRLHPDTGALAATDGRLAYAPTDRNAGRSPAVSASGYTDSVAGATSTALYGIDAAADTLVLQGTAPGADPAVSPNTGQLLTVGGLGRDVGTINGFDIKGTARHPGQFDPRDYDAVAAVQRHGQHGSVLVRVDLRTGRTFPLLALPLGRTVVGLTFANR